MQNFESTGDAKRSMKPELSLEEMARYGRIDFVDGEVNKEDVPIASVHELSRAVIDDIEEHIARGNDFYDMDVFSINAFIMRAIEAIAERDGAKDYTPYYRDFIKDIVAHVRFHLENTDKQRHFIEAFKKIFLSFSPNIFDRVGDFEGSMDILSQLRSVPQLQTYYEEKLRTLAHNYRVDLLSATYDDVVQKIAHFIERAPIVQQLQYVRVIRDIVTYSIDPGFVEKTARTMAESLRRIKNPSALLSVLIDDVQEDIAFMRRQETLPRRELTSANFWRNKFVDACVELPAVFTDFQTIAMAQDTLGLRNVYGDITHIIEKDAIGTRILGNVEISSDGKALLHAREIVHNFRKRVRLDIIPLRVRQRIETLVDRISEREVVTRIRHSLYGDSLRALEQILTQEITKYARQHGALGSVCVDSDEIEKLHFSNNNEGILFSEMHEPLMRDRVESIIGVRLTNVDRRTQAQLLDFLVKCDRTRLQKVRDVSVLFENEEQRRNFVRAFLSLEHGGQEMGEKIVTIGERYGQDIAARIFAKYTTLIDMTRNVEDYLNKQFDNADAAMAQEIAERLLVRGKNILQQFADNIMLDKGIVLEKLDNVVADVELFKIFVHVAQENNSIENIRDVRDISIDSKMSDELPLQVKEKLITLFKQNHDMSHQESARILLNEFRANLNDERSRAHIMWCGEDIVAFVLVRDGGESVYINGFNANKKFQDVRPGQSLLVSVINSYVEQQRILRASALPSDAMVYLRHGYFNTVVGKEEFAGNVYLLLERNDAINYISSNRQLYTPSVIVELCERGESDMHHVFAQWVPKDSIPSQLGEGFIATQIIPRKNGYIYLMEPKKEYVEQYTSSVREKEGRRS